MKMIQRILKILRLCTGVPALCDFIFVYGHGYSKFACLTKVLLACITLKPPTVWQLGKNNLDSLRRLPFMLGADAGTQNHPINICFCLWQDGFPITIKEL
jgi:hypothetical protein